MHHPTDRIIHTTGFATPVVEHWLEREIAKLPYLRTRKTKKNLLKPRYLYIITTQKVQERERERERERPTPTRFQSGNFSMLQRANSMESTLKEKASDLQTLAEGDFFWGAPKKVCQAMLQLMMLGDNASK